MIRFNASIDKQVQAAAVLIHLAGGRMDRLRLLKLLYIADRESLAERGAPIIGGRVVALDNGPLHSDVYDLIKGTHLNWSEWSRHFDNEGHVVAMKEDPGRLDLSPFEIDKLTEVSERYRPMDSWEVAEKTHDFPEWKESHSPGSSKTIPLERILAAAGFSAEEVRQIIAEAEAHKRHLRAMKQL